MKALLLLLPLAIALGCHSPVAPSQGTATSIRPAAPLKSSADPIARASTHKIPTAQPIELPGVHNVFHLGSHIVSGGEPMGRPGLEAIASLGVKTILSVDGKTPDATTATELGMRYVHIPIQYSGIGETELAQIAKTFRELEGPFFVHCFHGKHRGPAAAAVGRLVKDGISRDVAMAEMHQWAGTSLKYTGLFQTIGMQEIPSAETTAALDFDFPAAHEFEGFRATMIPMARSWDEIKFARKRDWALNPAKPDIVPAQEALQLSQVFASCLEQTDLPADTDEVQGWLLDGQKGTSDLARILSGQKELEASGTDWRAQAESAYRLVSKSCKDCHYRYRN